MQAAVGWLRQMIESTGAAIIAIAVIRTVLNFFRGREIREETASASAFHAYDRALEHMA